MGREKTRESSSEVLSRGRALILKALATRKDRTKMKEQKADEWQLASFEFEIRTWIHWLPSVRSRLGGHSGAVKG